MDFLEIMSEIKSYAELMAIKFLFPASERVSFHSLYSISRRAFFRLRLRANADLTRRFWPGFK